MSARPLPRRLGVAGLALGLTLGGAAVGITPTASASPAAPGAASPSAAAAAATKAPDKAAADRASRKLRRAVTVQGVRRHLLRLQAIADANDGNRAAGSEGYRESRDYVVGELRDAGYRPSVQSFNVDVFREVEPTVLENLTTSTPYTDPDDFSVMTYSGSGDVSAEVEPVDTDLTPSDTSSSGCEAADFTDFTDGSIALIQRGTCSFAQKAQNAGDAGAAAVIIVNRGTAGEEGPVAGTLGGPGDYVPVVGTSFAVGEELAEDGTTARVAVDAVSENARTWNVIAETRRGQRDNVVMAGAHLDSVPEGPGLNDNGSGSASLLALAEQYQKIKPKNRNQVRFAWWGAEEQGLLGSENYVSDLKANNPGALADIRMYLNFDMVGSPNFVRFVYDGDGSADGPVGPAGSAAIEKTFRRYFRSQSLASAPTAFDGRSDYGPFIAEGIPAGGLFSGAEGAKTKREARIFGGKAGEPYDACYHLECDNFGNVSLKAINQFSDAMADSVARYGLSTKPLQQDYQRRAAKAPNARFGPPVR